MSELIKNFGIDWRLLLAQAVNFLLLLFILKKFAYRPILEVLRKRRREIEKGLEFTQKADERLKGAEKERESKLKEAQGRALGIISAAESTARIKKDEITAEANLKVEEIVADAKRLIEEEKAKMSQEASRNTEELVRLGIGRVLGKMPPGERDEILIKEALKELKTAQNNL